MRNWLLAIIAMLGLTLPSLASAAESVWWEKAWPFRKEIIIDASPKGGNLNQSPGRTPVLVRLHSANFQFADAKENGTDLRFTSEDNKPLAFHIEAFDAKLGVATVWVDVPDFPTGATKKLWLYYGNKDAPSPGDSGGTFDADYSLVYHFDGTGPGPVKDRTAYGNHPISGPTGGYDAAGIIGRSARFLNAPITVAASPSLAISAGGSFTFSAWVKPAANGSTGALFAQRQGGSSLTIALEQGAPVVQFDGTRIAASQPLAAVQWTLLTVVADGEAGTVTIYANGAPAGAGAGRLPALNSMIAFGGDVAGGSLAPFVGEMDEIRISKAARRQAVAQADFAAQGPAAKLVSAGVDEKQGGHGGYFGVIVKSVTIDAWVVIAILGVMFAVAMLTIVSKVMYVTTVDGANSFFVKAFRHAGGDPMKFDDASHGRRLQASSIWRVYNEGAEEIRRRAEGGRPVLYAEAIEVLRSVMDATTVRENQKLSKGLVWLTIAISGGPFLGLLGTVVGVMITFAAIAQAGDVNINAIAPGISAALLATVAGLGVAIPALFGYNYILIRNRNITANMQVFVDEFVTRVSELYSERHAGRSAQAEGGR